MKPKRTNIAIDMNKIDAAKSISGINTTKAVVDFALSRLILSSKTLKDILKLKGKIKFDKKYNYKETR